MRLWMAKCYEWLSSSSHFKIRARAQPFMQASVTRQLLQQLWYTFRVRDGCSRLQEKGTLLTASLHFFDEAEVVVKPASGCGQRVVAILWRFRTFWLYMHSLRAETHPRSMHAYTCKRNRSSPCKLTARCLNPCRHDETSRPAGKLGTWVSFWRSVASAACGS